MNHLLKRIGALAMAATITVALCVDTLGVSAKMVSYTVQSGDMLGKIARKTGVSVEKLQTESGIVDPDKIYVGQIIVIRLDNVTEAGQKWVADQQKKGNVVEGIVNNVDYKKIGKTIAKKVELPTSTTLAKEELGFLYATFDDAYYAALYPDVKAALGTDKLALFQHWITYGSNEGREITADFSVNAYISANKDIKEAFDGGMIASLVHYYEYGQYEERITTVEGAVAAGVTVTTPTGAVVATPAVPKTEVVASAQPTIPTQQPTIPTQQPMAPTVEPSGPECEHQNYHYEADALDDASDEYDLFCCDDCDFTLPVSHDWVDGSCQYCSKAHDHTGEVKVVIPGSGTAANHSVVYADCNGDAGTEDHNWTDGICVDCGYDCVHSYDSNGVCDDCGYTCEHVSITKTEIAGDEDVHTITCDDCGYSTTEAHSFDSGVCDDCGYTCEHVSMTKTEIAGNGAVHTITCDDCGYSTTEAHSFDSGVCDDCGYTCEHVSMTKTEIAGNDAVHTLTCRTCGYSITEAHNYLQQHVCSGCSHTYSNASHNYVNGDCTVCGYQCPHTSYVTHVAVSGNDDEHNVVCDDCGVIVRTDDHIFTDQDDHKCRVCNYTHSVTAHNYVDGYCAICSISCSHSYVVVEKPGDDTNHSEVCSFCGKVWRDVGHNYLYNHTCSDCHHAHSASTHDYVYYSQNNGDHETCCRICGKTTYDDCADTDNDGKCDKCGYTMPVVSHIPGTDCYDEDGDHICDYPGCGAPVGGVLPPWITP